RHHLRVLFAEVERIGELVGGQQVEGRLEAGIHRLDVRVAVEVAARLAERLEQALAVLQPFQRYPVQPDALHAGTPGPRSAARPVVGLLRNRERAERSVSRPEEPAAAGFGPLHMIRGSGETEERGNGAVYLALQLPEHRADARIAALAGEHAPLPARRTLVTVMVPGRAHD